MLQFTIILSTKFIGASIVIEGFDRLLATRLGAKNKSLGLTIALLNCPSGLIEQNEVEGISIQLSVDSKFRYQSDHVSVDHAQRPTRSRRR